MSIPNERFVEIRRDVVGIALHIVSASICVAVSFSTDTRWLMWLAFANVLFGLGNLGDVHRKIKFIQEDVGEDDSGSPKKTSDTNNIKSSTP